MERHLRRPRRTKRLILRTMRTGPMPLSRAMRASGRVRLLVMDGSARCAGTSSKSMSFPMISSVLSAASGKRTSFASSCDRGVGLLLMQEFRFGCPFGAMGAAMFGGLFSVCGRERGGGIAPFRPSNSMPMSKNRCLENLEHRFCCAHNETALNQASLRCNNNLCTGKIPL